MLRSGWAKGRRVFNAVVRESSSSVHTLLSRKMGGELKLAPFGMVFSIALKSSVEHSIESAVPTFLALEAGSSYKFQSELKDTRGLRLRDLPEGRRVHVEYGWNQVDMVCHVEGLCPELNFCTLIEGEALVE